MESLNCFFTSSIALLLDARTLLTSLAKLALLDRWVYVCRYCWPYPRDTIRCVDANTIGNIASIGKLGSSLSPKLCPN